MWKGPSNIALIPFVSSRRSILCLRAFRSNSQMHYRTQAAIVLERLVVVAFGHFGCMHEQDVQPTIHFCLYDGVTLMPVLRQTQAP